eukprot:6178583-Amphidinium_carterae.1
MKCGECLVRSRRSPNSSSKSVGESTVQSSREHVMIRTPAPLVTVVQAPPLRLSASAAPARADHRHSRSIS